MRIRAPLAIITAISTVNSLPLTNIHEASSAMSVNSPSVTSAIFPDIVGPERRDYNPEESPHLQARQAQQSISGPIIMSVSAVQGALALALGIPVIKNDNTFSINLSSLTKTEINQLISLGVPLPRVAVNGIALPNGGAATRTTITTTSTPTPTATTTARFITIPTSIPNMQGTSSNSSGNISITVTRNGQTQTVNVTQDQMNQLQTYNLIQGGSNRINVDNMTQLQKQEIRQILVNLL